MDANNSAFDNNEKFEETLLTLNETQRQAALSDADNLQILAGPGSGKTRVLTVRVAYLVVKRNINPRNIVVVTFTNKAAKEMMDRLVVLIERKRTDQLLIGTFHSICNRLLRRFGGFIGIKNNFTIIEPKECEGIITEIKKDLKRELLNWTVKHATPGVIYGTISKAKSQGLTASKYADQANNDYLKNISRIYTKYEEELEKNNMVDFDNLLLKTCLLLRTKKNALTNVEAVLVDEYQDTNIVQYDLIKLITEQQNKKTVTIVGDPDQSIFGWRSAEPKNFSKMCEDFETIAINMEQNYRSTGTVLKSALHVIVQDKHRINKTLYTNNCEGVPISLIDTPNEDTQAEFVAKEIKRVIKYSKGLITYRDIAVLMRMNFISQKIESTFRRNMIPFTIIKGDRFFDRIEVKDILSYLRFAYNPSDSFSFKRILNVPKRGIGEVNMKKILTYRENQKITLMEALERIVNQKAVPSITAGLRNKLKELYEICAEIKNQIDEKEVDVAETLEWIILATKYKEYLEQSYKQDFDSRWTNLSELVSLAKDFCRKKEEGEDDELEDSSMYVSSQDPNFSSQYQEQKVKNPLKDQEVTVLDDADVLDLDDMPDDTEEVDLTTTNEDNVDDTQKSSDRNTQSFNNTQPFSSQGFSSQSFTQTQYSESNDVINEAFKDDFDVDDEPIYTANKTPLEDFLEYCSLCSNQKELEEAETEGGKVTVATMHASKGLEWPCVFILTCVDGIIPAEKGDGNEEGRLLYVAMTRSKFLLYCISPKQRNAWGQTKSAYRSCYLENMDRKLYVNTTSQWNNDIRRLLAVTIGKPIPPDDNKLCTTKADFDSHYMENQSMFENEAMDIRFGNGKPVNLDTMGGFTSALTIANSRTNGKRDNHYFKTPKNEKRTKRNNYNDYDFSDNDEEDYY